VEARQSVDSANPPATAGTGGEEDGPVELVVGANDVSDDEEGGGGDGSAPGAGAGSEGDTGRPAAAAAPDISALDLLRWDGEFPPELLAEAEGDEVGWAAEARGRREVRKEKERGGREGEQMDAGLLRKSWRTIPSAMTTHAHTG